MPFFKLPDAEHGKDLAKLVARVIREYHPDLKKAKLTIDLLLAFPTDAGSDEPALKHHGYPALATIKIRPGKERAEGRGDVLMSIDWPRFSEREAASQFAIIDHELTHVEIVKKDDAVRRDEYGRPKCTMRLHDRQYGWFDGVAQRHPEHSIEVEQAAELRSSELAQTYFPSF